MNLLKEFKEARDWVKESMTIAVPKEVNFFETTIRVLGGLLSAFHLSRDDSFISKAVSEASENGGLFLDQKPWISPIIQKMNIIKMLPNKRRRTFFLRFQSFQTKSRELFVQVFCCHFRVVGREHSLPDAIFDSVVLCLACRSAQ
jgi:hypothetical protein